MTAKGQTRRVSEGEAIFSKVGLLVFLGVFLLGVGADRPLWTAAYRAFFVWLVFAFLGGSLRVGWKYHLYRRRELDLQRNLDHARQEEERLFRERRERRDRLIERSEADSGQLAGDGDGTTDEARDRIRDAIREAAQAKSPQ